MSEENEEIQQPSDTTLLSMAMPFRVLVEMEVYASDGDGWVWVKPVEERHSNVGVNVNIRRLSESVPVSE